MEREILIESPGYFYAISYVLSVITYTFSFKKRLNPIQYAVCSLCFGLILAVFMTSIVNPRGFLFVTVMLIVVASLMFFVRMILEQNLYTSICCTMYAFILGEFVASISWQLFYFTYIHYGIENTFGVHMVFLLPCCGFFYAIVFLVQRYLVHPSIRYEENRLDAITSVLISITIYLLSNLSFMDWISPFTSETRMDLYYIRTLVDFTGVFVLYATFSTRSRIMKGYENHQMKELMELQYSNYQMSKLSVELINQKYHDLKHQLTVLKNYQGNGEELDSYIDSIQDQIDNYATIYHTGNGILDTILTQKAMYCKKHGICLEVIADGSTVSFIHEFDLCALFGNLLDNAIEAVEKLEIPEERIIRLYVSKAKGFLIINQENRCIEQVNLEDGIPSTSKEDKRYHGFGVKSIRDTVARYGGSSKIEIADQWFDYRILIPIPSQNNVKTDKE